MKIKKILFILLVLLKSESLFCQSGYDYIAFVDISYSYFDTTPGTLIITDTIFDYKSYYDCYKKYYEVIQTDKQCFRKIDSFFSAIFFEQNRNRIVKDINGEISEYGDPFLIHAGKAKTPYQLVSFKGFDQYYFFTKIIQYAISTFNECDTNFQNGFRTYIETFKNNRIDIILKMENK